MNEWLAWATFAPAPEGHCGYSFLNIGCEVERKYGGVFHSAGGKWGRHYRPVDTMRVRGNSWDATFFLDGSVEKHRHTPLWVNWHAGGPMQNILLWGWEVEGRHDEPWTPEQTASIKRALIETWAYCGLGEPKWGWIGSYQNNQDVIKIMVEDWGCNLWDHKMLSNTVCPGRRNDAHRDEVRGWLKEEEMAIDWPLEREKLCRDFMAWLVEYPLTQEEKDNSARQLAEEFMATRFYQRQISWRRPGIEG